MRKIYCGLFLAAAMLQSCNMLENIGLESKTVGFEDLNLNENGYISSLPYTSEDGIVTFNNVYNSDYGSYEGFAFSKLVDKETPGYANQFSVYADSGNAGSDNFAVYYYNTYESAIDGRKIEFDGNSRVNLESVYVNNSTYVALDIMNGSEYSKKFEDGDWFLLTVMASKADGQKDSVDFYLADFRDGKEYICKEWTKVSLRKLTDVVSVDFILRSSDVGMFGMNTPAFCCMDDFAFKYKKF